MKKALLTIGSMVAVATPVVVAVSCGGPEDMTIVKTINGIDFSIRNGKVINIQIADGSQLHGAKMIASAVRDAVNSEDGISEGVKSAMPEQEVQWLPLIHFDIQPAEYEMGKFNEFVASQDQAAWEQYLAAPSTHGGTNPGTSTNRRIDVTTVITVDLTNPTDVATKYAEFMRLSAIPGSIFALEITKGSETGTMVYAVNPTESFDNTKIGDSENTISYTGIDFYINGTLWTHSSSVYPLLGEFKTLGATQAPAHP